jgi:hypothetical protein
MARDTYRVQKLSEAARSEFSKLVSGMLWILTEGLQSKLV